MMRRWKRLLGMPSLKRLLAPGMILLLGCCGLAALAQDKNNTVLPDAAIVAPCAAATAAPQANEQLLYFTSTSLLEGDRQLVFISDRTGQPNIFVRDLASGAERQLSDNTEGFLKSYVYFDGLPYRGFGKASVSVDARRGLAYYIQGRELRVVDMQGRRRTLAELPEGQMTAFTHVSADGERLCVPTTDARALEGDTPLKGKPAYNIDARVRSENLSSYLRVYDTASGRQLLCERVPQAWITHVQFSPVNHDQILYNHEWPSDCGIRRVWLWDGQRHIRLRPEGDGRSRADWTCHEMWERDGAAIIYHGAYDKGPAYIGRVRPDGTGRVEIPLPAGWKRYGHFTEGRPGVLVSDGYYERPGDPAPKGSGAWICQLNVDWAARTIQWVPLCRNGSSWRSQDEHPHPIFNHAADAIFFTSDKSGKRAVYRIDVSGLTKPIPRAGLLLSRGGAGGGFGRGGGASAAAAAIEQMLTSGTLAAYAPKPGERLGGAQGPQWTSVTLDAKGAPARRGEFLYLPIESGDERVMILNAAGHGAAYFNGEPRAGDVYNSGYVHLPVLLHRGVNGLLLGAGRGAFSVKLYAPPAPVFMLEADKTLPDLAVGEAADTWGAVIVINATQQAARGLILTSYGGGLSEQSTDLPPIPPLSIRKVGFRIAAPAPAAKGKVAATLALHREGEPAAQSTIPLALQVVEGGDSRKVTFVSEIDGSVQYYAVRRAVPLAPGDPAPALVLSCHGASVEASGQAAAYAAKPWLHLVAPTNRRPYGFDWEDFGRLDALEVLRLAKAALPYDPARVYLTGHSMGGHGAWHLGVTYPDLFAAVGPSAGWISRETYGGGGRGGASETASPLDALLRRGRNVGDTMALASNLKNSAVYILHGSDDDNVPVGQARRMAELLGRFHRDWTFHEEPGKGHWWGNELNDGGSACVDYPGMFDLFARHALAPPAAVRDVEFATANPGVSSRCHWLAIEAQQRELEISSASLHAWPVTGAIKGATRNVAVLRLDVGRLMSATTFSLELDGQALKTVSVPAGAGSLWLGREGGNWKVIPQPAAAMKNPRRYGPIKDELQHRFVFVYGSRGDADENAWAFAKARFDAESFWYRGNGAVEIIKDAEFGPAAWPERTVVLYGNAETNAAWPALLAGSPVQARRGAVTLGGRVYRGEDLAVIFVRPRPGSAVASVIAISGSGAAGLRSTYPVSFFSPFMRYPDCVVTRAGGRNATLAAGFFGLDWSLERGEFEYAAE